MAMAFFVAGSNHSSYSQTPHHCLGEQPRVIDLAQVVL